MKRHLILCIALMTLMTSCVKEPTILRRLTAEDAAAIPYHIGQTVNFMDENGDTLNFTVTYDETKPFSEDYWEYPYDAKMSIIRQPWCYARTVQMYSHSDSTNALIMFTVIPEKYLYFRWNNGMALPYIDLKGDTQTMEVNGVTYENVHVNSYTNPTGEYFHRWYYNEEVGLIAVKDQNHSLTLIP
ncbi:MAG: hypothetical protein Q4F82_12330 [bacterium]|nr:hypothetical protein [bacterium]